MKTQHNQNKSIKLKESLHVGQKSIGAGGTHGKRIPQGQNGEGIEEGCPGRADQRRARQLCLPAIDPPGSQGSLSKVNNLLTLSFSLVSQPKPSNQGVHEKSVHRESEP